MRVAQPSSDRNDSPAELLSVEAARRRMLGGVATLAHTETVDPGTALGRILAADIRSPIDVPPADNSAMDGYALRIDDLTETDCRLPVSDCIQAGTPPRPLAPATAARIFTGALIPAGADTVVMQEHCRAKDGQVTIERLPVIGANIRRGGEDIVRGARVLKAGICLQPQHLGLLASVGQSRIPVRSRPRVQVLSTGDELVDPGRSLRAGQIYSSNDTVLAGLLARMGCEPIAPLRVPDHREATLKALEQARDRSDLVLTSGGISVGETDYVKPAVEAMGRLDLWKINLKPGKPVAFGYLDQVPFIGLPGNPVSVFVTFCLFAAPLIRHLQGRHSCFPAPVRLPAIFDLPAGKREEYLRVRICNSRLERYPHQGSGVMSSIAWADGLARVAAGTTVTPGELVDYFSFEALMA